MAIKTPEKALLPASKNKAVFPVDRSNPLTGMAFSKTRRKALPHC
jgi:hypothetical protein